MANFGVKQPRVIYFTAGMVPTDVEVAEIHQCGNNVVVRNGGKVDAQLSPGQIEPCEYVAGAVPPQYAAKYKAMPGLTARAAAPQPEPEHVGKLKSNAPPLVPAPAPAAETDPAAPAPAPAWKPNT